MPIQGNMGPIMRKPDPQRQQLRGPVPKNDSKGVMILGSRMTREDLLDYIRTKRLEAEEKRNYQPPPPPPTERQAAQAALEIAAGQRRLAHFAALEAQQRPAVAREKAGSEAANEADTTSRSETDILPTGPATA
jgi:hypothetical protein